MNPEAQTERQHSKWYSLVKSESSDALVWSWSVQPGDLVRITRASIAVPRDTIGLIVKARLHEFPGQDPVYTLFHVQLVTDTKLNGTVRRYLTQDLRKVR